MLPDGNLLYPEHREKLTGMIYSLVCFIEIINIFHNTTNVYVERLNYENRVTFIENLKALYI